MATIEKHSTLVRWREWGEDAFREAGEQDKPILLDIGAVWCHWCHVMDTGIAGDPVHTGTYSRPDIAELINARYVPIKVDNDRRPDINARYNMGGWPTTAFLTPAGDTLYGETYVPPDRMLDLLQHIAGYYANSKDEIAERIREHEAASREPAAADSSAVDSGRAAATITSAIVGDVSDRIKGLFDFQFGGFGSQPKFPQAGALEFAVRRLAETGNGDGDLRVVAEKTLLAMAGGGMYDHFAGGFFRYSTTRDWSVPHFEKMLEDNAELSRVYLLAARAFGDPRYAEIARDVHGWLFEVMHGGALPDSPSPTFAGSQDADAEEAYYGLALDERAKLPTPFIDRTVYLGWNAMMISSLAERYRQFGEDAILDAARETYAFLKSAVWPLHYFDGGQAQGQHYLLADVSAMLDASLDLCDIAAAAGEAREYLLDAKDCADVLLNTLYDPSQRGFNDMPQQSGALGALSQPKQDLDGTAKAVAALLKLYAYTGDTRLHRVCVESLNVYAALGEDGYRAYGLFAARYAAVVADALAEPVHVVIVGGEKASASLRAAAWSAARAGEFVACELRGADEAGEYPAPVEQDGALAYVCVGSACQSPVGTEAELEALWTRLREQGQVR